VNENPRPLLVERRADGIVIVRLNRPAERHALDRALMDELTAFARGVRTDTAIHTVVLTGGPACFSAGADLGLIGSIGAGDRPGLLQLRELVRSGPDLCRAWEEIEAVTIAAVEGHCIGGGCALAAACDFRIAGRGAGFRLPEVPLGLNMSWGSIPRLTTLLGPARAKRLVIFGEAVDASTAAAWGLVDEVVEDGQAEAAALRWGARVGALPPLPVRMSKEAVNACANALHHAASFMDRDQFLLAALSDDLREGVRAFRQKRSGRFKGN
jgi:enoyl-CoA hydratase/carnithine racemase